jgi:hypothetical protein
MEILFRSHHINLLNEFILNKIPENESSLIKIVDVGNFLVLKGFTTSSENLNMFDIVKEFREVYNLSEDVKLNTIDLIEYSSKYEYFNNNDTNIVISTKHKLHNI